MVFYRIEKHCFVIEQPVTNKGGTYIDVKFQNKWVDKTVTYSQEYCNNNFIVLRYADLLLLLSEATGDSKYLNEVRGRIPGLPLYGDATYPAQYNTLELAIEHERRVELAMEFHRWFDLKRTGRAAAVLGPKKGRDIYPYLPIPQNVIDENPGVITQNAPWKTK